MHKTTASSDAAVKRGGGNGGSAMRTSHSREDGRKATAEMPGKLKTDDHTESIISTTQEGVDAIGGGDTRS